MFVSSVGSVHPRLNSSEEVLYFSHAWFQLAVSQKLNPQVITGNNHKWLDVFWE